MAKRSRGARDAPPGATAVLAHEVAPELFAERDDGYNQISDLILPVKVKKPVLSKEEKARAAEAARAPPLTRTERRLSKSQAKKLARLDADREKKARRISLFESLKKSELSPEQMALLYHSGALGHKLSAKEQVTRAFREEKLGVTPSSDAAATTKKTAVLHVDRAVSDSSDAEDVTDEEMSTQPVGAGATRVDVGAARGRTESGDTSDSSSDADTPPPAKRVRWAPSADEASSSSPSDSDVETDDDDDEEDEEEEDEDEDGTDGSAGPSDSDELDDSADEEDSETGSSEGGKGPTNKTAPLNFAPSKFAFSFSLAGVKKHSVPAESSSTDHILDASSERQPPAVHSSEVLLSGRHKVDHSMVKLQELRERNVQHAHGSSSDSDADDDAVPTTPAAEPASGPGVSDVVSTTAAQLDRLGVDMPLASAADLLVAREKLDAIARSIGDDDAAAPGAPSTAASAEAVLSDPNLLRAAMWSADGYTRISTDHRRALSQLSAYAPHPVIVRRENTIQDARSQLPVCGMETEIMEAIHDHDVVVLCGETGSGKTTQVPQFLYEAGYAFSADKLTKRVADGAFPNATFNGIPGVIAVTQPRRVAATATAQRVADEMGSPVGSKHGVVGYQVRYDSSTVNSATKIKFMTDGILLREIQDDLLLRKYSVIILDEAHERNLNTDVLIGLLSRAVPLRNAMAKEQAEQFASGELAGAPLPPLKLIIMSATLRVSDFVENARLFPQPPPVVNVQGRQYPVSVHFARKTELDDYVNEAYRKVVKIHTRLPEGGILVFLTGQDEIEYLVRKLTERFDPRKTPALAHSKEAVREDAVPNTGSVDEAPEADAKDAAAEDEPAAEEEVGPVRVLPLFALLPKSAQLRVFEPPPAGHRLIVVATNVAETSLTIPGIRYVVDAGRVKRKVYETRSGTSQFQISWISQASADQRAGRAGRTGPGHCYRLFSSAVFGSKFDKFEPPEIHTMPIESVVLNMKTLGIDCVAAFPFPSPPKSESLLAAIRRLRNLGALTVTMRTVDRVLGDVASLRAIQAEALTPLGRQVAALPLHPSLAKMLVIAAQQQAMEGGAAGTTPTTLLEYAIALVACLAVQSPFLRPPSSKSAGARPNGGKTATPGVPEERASGEGDDNDDDDNDDDASIIDEVDDMDPELLAEFGASSEGAPAPGAPAPDARNVAAAAHAKFRHPLSDALSVLRAVGAFSHVLDTAGTAPAMAFCRKFFLRPKSMQEITKLRKQLHTQVYSTLMTMLTSNTVPAQVAESTVDAVEAGGAEPAPDVAFRVCMRLPDTPMENSLRQIIAAGLLENVARRAPPDVVAELVETGKLRKGWVPYLSTSAVVPGTLYVHPHSAAFDSDVTLMPSVLVFNEIVVGKYAYMRGCTVVESGWLSSLAAGTPLVRFGPPLDSPPPYYDSSLDDVMVTVVPYFGDVDWRLAPVPVPCPSSSPADADTRLRTFARAFLEGQVVAGLLPFVRHYAVSPSLVTKKAHQKRIVLYLDTLSHPPRECAALGPIDSGNKLARVWKAYPSFLSTEVKAWLGVEHHAVLDKSWGAIVQHFLKRHST